MTPSPVVVAAAKAAMHATRVPASVQIAQFALESGWGAHEPPGSNNPFGVKDFHGADAVWAMTTEVIHGQVIHEKQPFKRYASLEAAFDDHALLFVRIALYAPAMAALPNVDNFVVLMAKHYATDPDYARKILALIRADGLATYDAA